MDTKKILHFLESMWKLPKNSLCCVKSDVCKSEHASFYPQSPQRFYGHENRPLDSLCVKNVQNINLA